MGCKKAVEFVLLTGCVVTIVAAFLLCAVYVFQNVEVIQIVNLETASAFEKVAVELDQNMTGDGTNWTMIADYAVEWRIK